MIRRKIKLGFFFIGILLFLSGVISSAELFRLNRATADLLASSSGNIELSKSLLDGVEIQNAELLKSVTDSIVLDRELLTITRERFDSTLSNIRQAFVNFPQGEVSIARIEFASKQYNAAIDQVRGEITLPWFIEKYSTKYTQLTNAIKEFMIVNEESLLITSQEVESKAYRASMVGISALTAGILLLLIFFLMVKGFFITPILQIENSLRRYVERGIPYSVEVKTKDEIASLNQSIMVLIDRYKRK